jgi:hypothetical protein
MFLQFGASAVDVRLDDRSGLLLGMTGTNAESDGSAADLLLTVEIGKSERLELDVAARCMLLTVSEFLMQDDVERLEIAILQASARGLALVLGPRQVLLHGSAVTFGSTRTPVAVLDAGRGWGKTSLALSLALKGGDLVVDEFCFASLSESTLTIPPVPQVPWHVRSDMTQVLLSRKLGHGLVRADDLGLSFATTPKTPALILFPDCTIAAGHFRSVGRDEFIDAFLSSARDHLAKLFDPSLDRVSIFKSSSQIVVSLGRSFREEERNREQYLHDMMNSIAAIPAFMVGIGVPAELPLSSKAAEALIALSLL